MTSPEPVPEPAITAGEDTLMAARGLHSAESRRWAHGMVLDVLEGAAPAIRAAERDRLMAEEIPKIPEVMIKIDGTITQEQLDELKAKWRAAWEASKGKPLEPLPDPPVYQPVADLIAEAVAAERDRIRQLEQAAREMLACIDDADYPPAGHIARWRAVLDPIGETR